MEKKLTAEFLGTFWLTFGGCGSAIFAAAHPVSGIGFAGVAMAFGLTVLTMAYAVGPISGGHFNPAVTIGLWVGKRISGIEVLPYILVQVLGAIAASGALFLVAAGKPGFEIGGFAANGYGDLSPGNYSLAAAIGVELITSFIFMFIIMRVTAPGAALGIAPLAIGLTLTLIHLISIPITNTSVNPARSTGPALFAGGLYIGQLWLFWVVPIAGAMLGALTANRLNNTSREEAVRAQ